MEGSAGFRRPVGFDAFTASEILAEIDLILSDLERLVAERPGEDAGLMLAANTIASLRDLSRSTDSDAVGLGHLAGLITSGWLLVLAGADDRPDSFLRGVARSRMAVADSGRATRLGRELHEFIDAIAGGELEDEQFLRRLTAARPPPLRVLDASAGSPDEQQRSDEQQIQGGEHRDGDQDCGQRQ
jgi:hypothetical protein